MRKISILCVILIVIISVASCGDKVLIEDEIATKEQIFGNISFQKPIEWIVSEGDSENSILLESGSTDPNPSVIVVSKIKDINMSAMDYAISVHESLDNTTEPVLKTFGENSFPLVTIMQNTSTYNYFFKDGVDVYSFTYANLENKIGKELEALLSSVQIGQQP
ncbi:MAG: hypothetical protein KAH30_02845 [Caldisericia bacterium]|nr:hypothetical protein [Caldisericia bacterium]